MSDPLLPTFDPSDFEGVDIPDNEINEAVARLNVLTDEQVDQIVARMQGVAQANTRAAKIRSMALVAVRLAKFIAPII